MDWCVANATTAATARYPNVSKLLTFNSYDIADIAIHPKNVIAKKNSMIIFFMILLFSYSYLFEINTGI
jgi:hypothetical protein